VAWSCTAHSQKKKDWTSKLYYFTSCKERKGKDETRTQSGVERSGEERGGDMMRRRDDEMMIELRD
jgi:hypothetical protein